MSDNWKQQEKLSLKALISPSIKEKVLSNFYLNTSSVLQQVPNPTLGRNGGTSQSMIELHINKPRK